MEGKDGKTERATGKKRSKERAEGNMCISPEINSMAVLLFGIIAFRFAVPVMWRELNAMIVSLFKFELLGDWSSESFKGIFSSMSSSVVAMLSPIILPVMLAAVISNISQTKPYFSTKPLKWKFSKLNPIKGFKQLFSTQAIVKLVVSLMKIFLVVIILYFSLRRHANTFFGLSNFPLIGSIQWTFKLAFRISITVAVIFSVVAAVDWCYRKYKYEQGIMMTKQEVKDERKQQEQNPVIKRAQMKKMREFTLMSMMAAVPKANVIITNPTHVAIALEYDPENMDSPKVTAKGLRLVAKRIKKLAIKHNIPIVEKPPLARAIYKTVPVGQQVPSRFFEAIAEIMAYLYKIGHGIGVSI